MLKSIILRYRDFGDNTISEHISVKNKKGYVWWGWWKKEDEPNQSDNLVTLKKLIKDKKQIEIGLFDNSTNEFVIALLEDCLFLTDCKQFDSPEKEYTPEYYRNAKVQAWFKISDFKTVLEKEFEEKFSSVPGGDKTFFPVFSDKVLDDKDKIQTISNTIPCILHLSDLHFGKDFGFPDKFVPGKKPLLDILVKDIEKTAPLGVGIIIITGDLISYADANLFFDNVIPFLNELVNKLEVDKKNVIIVPGNHDIPLQNYNMHTYNHESTFNVFLEKFYEKSNIKKIQMYRYKLTNNRVIEILPLSSVRLRSPEDSNFGYVEWQLYDNYLDSILAPKPNAIRIAVLHHHLTPAIKEELINPNYPHAGNSITLDAGAILEGLQRHNFRFVLHGHQHVPCITNMSRAYHNNTSSNVLHLDRNVYIIAGGSAGAKSDRLNDEMRENTYNIINISEKEFKIRIRSYTKAGTGNNHYFANLPL